MDREARLEELLAEAHDRQASGPAFDLEAFCREHPEHAEELRAHLRVLPHADRALGGRAPPAERERVRTAVRRLLERDRDAGSLRDPAHYKNLFPGFWDLVAEEHDRVAPGSFAGGPSRPTLKEGELEGGLPLPAAVPGERLGPYRLVRELGRGGMGVVYLAEDTRLPRRAAVKVLSPVFASSEILRRRFEREASLASRLEHPGICTVFEIGEDGGIPFIAMQYLEGETLEHWIHAARGAAGTSEAPPSHVTNLPRSRAEGEEPAPPPPGPSAGRRGRPATGAGTEEEIHRLLFLVERAARALHHAHEAGLIHRDIKPGNLMITLYGDPVLLDFGLARDEDAAGLRLTQTGALMGTPAYMSPEQIAAQRIRLDRRTDVYSLGVTLYEALTLRLPFTAASRDTLYQKILVSEPENPRRLNPAIPSDLRIVLDKTLEKDRDRRYPTALEFAEELRRIRIYEPIRARPPGPLTRMRRWTQRNRGTAGALLVLALLTAGLPPLVLGLVSSAREAARERMLRDSVLTRFADEIRAAERSADPEIRQSASRLMKAETMRVLGRSEEARGIAEEAHGAAASRPGGEGIARVIREFLETLDRETAK